MLGTFVQELRQVPASGKREEAGQAFPCHGRLLAAAVGEPGNLLDDAGTLR